MSEKAKQSARYPYLALCICVLAFFALIACERERVERARIYYADALSTAYAYEDVSIDGSDYSVVDGIAYHNGSVASGRAGALALQLAYAKALARRDPLISLSGTDPGDLETAIASLKSAQEELAAMQKSSTSSAAVREYLYPDDFLSDLPGLERSRLAFLQGGTLADEDTYERALRATISDYLTDIARYRAAFKRFVPGTIRSYSTTGLVISRGQTLAAIDSMERGMEHTRSVFEHRLRCSHGASGACQDSDIRLPDVVQRAQEPISVAEQKQAASVRSILADALMNPNLASHAFPLIALDDSACAAGSSLPALFVIAPNDSFVASTTITTPVLVGDIRLTKTANFPTVPFLRFFAERGIPYIPSNPILHYECPYMGNDFGAAFGVRITSSRAAAEPASSYASGSEKEMLLALEQSLSLSSGILRESDARAYAEEVRALAQAPEAPQALRDTAAELGLAFKDPTPGFSNAVAWVAEIEKRNATGAREHGLPVDLNLDTLFYYRSAYMLLFMGTNSSVVGETHPYFEVARIPEESQPYTYYSDIARTPRATAELERYLLAYFAIHRADTPGKSSP